MKGTQLMGKRCTAATIAALALVTAACGGGEAGASGDTLKIGAVLSLTGSYAPSAKYVKEGYKYWVDEVNAHGGIDGRKVELVIRDDQSDPATAATLARSLVEKQDVEFILGPYGSGATDTMAATVESLQVPMLGTIASDSEIWERRQLHWTFQAFPSSDYDHEAFLHVAEQKGLDRITIVYEDAGFSVNAAEWAKKQAESQGMTVQMLSYPSGAQDFSSIVAKAKAFGPDALSMGGYYEPSVLLTKEMIAQNFHVQLYHFIQAADGVTKEALGSNVEGLMGRSSWEPQLDTKGNEQFTTGYEKKFGREPSYHSAAAYAAGEVAEAALEAGDGDAEAVRDFLASKTVETVCGTYKVNDAGQQEGYKYVGIQWIDGEKQIVWPEDAATAEVEFPMPEWNS
jgi:branched-chain amino acid transport system substrate-binding protein